MAFTFPAMVAEDPATNAVVKNVSFQVYAVTDTGFSTPLPITDTFNNPLAGGILNSGTKGIFPQFQQATNSTVVIADATKVYAWTINCVQQDSAISSFINTPGSATATALSATYAPVSGSANYASFVSLAKNPDTLIAGAVTVDSNNYVTSAAVVWPDGSPGTLTITSRDSTGAVLGYNITYGSPVTKTFTQPTITRNTAGAATNVPQIVVS